MKILVIGCGRVGAGLAQALERRGHALTVVDVDAAAFARLGPLFKGRQITGFALDRAILQSANIELVDGLAAVTGSDEINVVVSRLARNVFHVPRVVARVYDPRKADIYRRLGVHTISPIGWGVNRLTDSLAFPELDVPFSLGSGEVELVEAEVHPLLVGRTVLEVTIPGQVHIVAIKRAGRYQLPAPATALQPDDVLCVAVVATAVDRLRALLGLV